MAQDESAAEVQEPRELEELPEPRVLTEEEKNRLALKIVGLARAKTLEMNLSIGRNILEEIFHNLLAVWNRHAENAPSFTEVAQTIKDLGHAELGRHHLSRCVKLVEQETVLGGLNKWPNLGSSHFFVAQVVNLAQQASLFDKVNPQAPSVRAFRELVLSMTNRLPPEPKAGKVAADAIFRCTEELRAVLAKHDQMFLDLGEAGLAEPYIKAFHDSFEHFTGDVEDLELILPTLGATIPDDLLEELRQRSAKRMEPYTKAAEAGRKAAEGVG